MFLALTEVVSKLTITTTGVEFMKSILTILISAQLLTFSAHADFFKELEKFNYGGQAEELEKAVHKIKKIAGKDGEYTCYLTTPFDGSYKADGKNEEEAKFNVIQNCTESAGAFWCDKSRITNCESK